MCMSQRQLVRLYMDREWWLTVSVLALGRQMQADVYALSRACSAWQVQGYTVSTPFLHTPPYITHTTLPGINNPGDVLF